MIKVLAQTPKKQKPKTVVKKNNPLNLTVLPVTVPVNQQPATSEQKLVDMNAFKFKP
jgi:hypothetical protein